MTTSTWLAQHIRTTTGSDPGARWAKVASCRTCRADVLRGENDDQLAFVVDADPTPLGPLGEALALLHGQATLILRTTVTDRGLRFSLHRRDRWQIGSDRPPRRCDVDVLAVHACGLTLPGVASRFRPWTAQADLDQPPPF